MEIKIANYRIGESNKVFVIAELSANHNHNFDIAINSLRSIKECGADAVKIQTYTADTLTIDSDKDYFKIQHGTIWDGTTLYKLYKQAYTPWEWQPKLKQFADEIGLVLFSSPFDRSAVDFLENINIPAYKIASFEIVDLPLIEYVASKKKPVIISTGIATEDEIKDAVNACRKVGNNEIALLKCTSEYPALVEDTNLKTIPVLSERFQTVTGLSDHTFGITVPIAAAAIGARIIEKHFILNRDIGGPDAAFSLEPEEFKKMVVEIRQVEKALGTSNFELNDRITNNRIFARSLFVVADIKAGETFTEDNIRSIRPSNGLPPKYFYSIIGEKATKNIERGTPLSWEMISNTSFK